MWPDGLSTEVHQTTHSPLIFVIMPVFNQIECNMFPYKLPMLFKVRMYLCLPHHHNPTPSFFLKVLPLLNELANSVKTMIEPLPMRSCQAAP